MGEPHSGRRTLAKRAALPIAAAALVLALTALVLALTQDGATGSVGAQGPAGQRGTTGPIGPVGSEGTDYSDEFGADIARLIDTAAYLCGSLSETARQSAEVAFTSRVATVAAENAEARAKADAEAEATNEPPGFVPERATPTRGYCEG